MKKEEYIKPEMQVILLKSNTPLLAGSMNLYEEEVEDENDIL